MIKRLFFIFIMFMITVLPVFAIKDYGPNWTKTPIDVYIPKDEKYSSMMERAFSKWQNMSFEQLKFNFVTEKTEDTNIDIEVKFGTETDGTDGDLGSYSLTVKGGEIKKAEIIIVPDDKNYSQNMIFTVMLHEIGHALGLRDTKRNLGIMHSPVNETQDIITNDIFKLYQLNGWSYINKGTFSKF